MESSKLFDSVRLGVTFSVFVLNVSSYLCEDALLDSITGGDSDIFEIILSFFAVKVSLFILDCSCLDDYFKEDSCFMNSPSTLGPT